MPVVLLLDRDRPKPYLTPALPAVNPTQIVQLDRSDSSYLRVTDALSKLLAGENGRQPRDPETVGLNGG